MRPARRWGTPRRKHENRDAGRLMKTIEYKTRKLTVTARKQAIVDAFYKKHGACCAGCDWWRWHNAVVGECVRTAPVSGAERFAMLSVTGSSLAPEAGHIMTRRDHVCGEFRDTDSQTPNGEVRGGGEGR